MHKTFIDHLGILANSHQVLIMYQVLRVFILIQSSQHFTDKKTEAGLLLHGLGEAK